jgi:hypothetical protein
MYEASQTIGIRAILVHAKDERAAGFYTTFGFVPSPTNSRHLLLMVKDIAKILSEKRADQPPRHGGTEKTGV